MNVLSVFKGGNKKSKTKAKKAAKKGAKKKTAGGKKKNPPPITRKGKTSAGMVARKGGKTPAPSGARMTGTGVDPRTGKKIQRMFRSDELKKMGVPDDLALKLGTASSPKAFSSMARKYKLKIPVE
jgi:hypothetical protein